MTILEKFSSKVHSFDSPENSGQRNIKKYVGVYSLVFILLSFIVFSFFWLNGKSFVWQEDGMQQHFRALVYYGQWLREIFTNIFVNHSFSIPEWSFSLGYGGDILTTLHYYVIGDPFSFLSAFVPSSLTVYLYGFLIILRLYFAGLAFSAYCFKVTKTGSLGILTSSLIYVFSAYGLFASVRHPYFINPMIYLPLILLGVEKLLNKEKPYILILSVFIACISNFYFFYMIVLLTVIYVAIRVLFKFKRNQIADAVKFLGKLFSFAVLGVLMASVIFIPTIVAFLGESRSGSGYIYNALYPSSYYTSFLSSFLSFQDCGYWSYMGFSGLSLIAVTLLFLKRKQNSAIKFGFIALTVMLLFPVFGHIFNGFSYVTNRWIWGYGFVVALICAFMWHSLFKLNEKEKKCIALVISVYFILCIILTKSRTENLFICIGISLICLLIVGLFSGSKSPKSALSSMGICFMVVLSIITNAIEGYSPYESVNYISMFPSLYEVNTKIFDNQDEAVKLAMEQTESTEFSRYSGTNTLELNTSLQGGLSSTVYYWSLANGNMINYQKELALKENTNYLLKNLDNRTILNDLAAVKYYVYPDGNGKDKAPYGFSLIDVYQVGGRNFSVYENKNALPLTYTYSSYISKDEYLELLPNQKQEALLDSAVLENNIDFEKNTSLDFSSKDIPYTIDYSDGIKQIDDKFVVTNEGATITLNFTGQNNSETYLYVDGMDYKGTNQLELYNDDETIDPDNIFNEEAWSSMSVYSRNLTKDSAFYWAEPTEVYLSVNAKSKSSSSNNSINYFTPKSQLYGNRHEFFINFGYEEEPKTSIRINFPKLGTYTMEDIKVICQPMDTVDSKIPLLKENSLEDVVISEDEITGNISLDSSKILAFSVPYSKGWTAYVDGEKTDILQVNTMFMALPLTAGTHTVTLKYQTPMLRISAIISFAAFSLFIILCVTLKIRAKKIKTSV